MERTEGDKGVDAGTYDDCPKGTNQRVTRGSFSSGVRSCKCF